MTTRTIYAPGTGRPPAAIAIIRISGPDTRFVVETMAGDIEPRSPRLRSIRDRNGNLLDRGMVTRFQSPASPTGEDYAEFHLHGGSAVVAATMSSLAELGARMAEPGEFTRRALLNGKLDLSAAEAIADLVDAETEMQRRIAVEGARGAQAALYERWRSEIMALRAATEATIDFSDEDDVGSHTIAAVVEGAQRVSREIQMHLAEARGAEIVRSGFRVAIAGAPNAGKSSLLNALARRDAAIVSEVPGTTRDLVEIALDLGGYKVVITDTAGLRDTHDPIERIGIDRARSAAREADLVLLLSEDGKDVDACVVASARRVLRVASKSDLARSPDGKRWGEVAVSAISGEGLDDLVAHIAHGASLEADGAVLPLRARHVEHLIGCRASLDVVGEKLRFGAELGAECLREAADSLGRITGRVGVEDMLDALFARFCIGK